MVKKQTYKFCAFFIFSLNLYNFAAAQNVYIDTTFNNLIRKNSGGWVAADATYSIYLPDGRTLCFNILKKRK